MLLLTFCIQKIFVIKLQQHRYTFIIKFLEAKASLSQRDKWRISDTIFTLSWSRFHVLKTSQNILETQWILCMLNHSLFQHSLFSLIVSKRYSRQTSAQSHDLAWWPSINVRLHFYAKMETVDLLKQATSQECNNKNGTDIEKRRLFSKCTK